MLSVSVLRAGQIHVVCVQVLSVCVCFVLSWSDPCCLCAGAASVSLFCFELVRFLPCAKSCNPTGLCVSHPRPCVINIKGSRPEWCISTIYRARIFNWLFCVLASQDLFHWFHAEEHVIIIHGLFCVLASQDLPCPLVPCWRACNYHTWAVLCSSFPRSSMSTGSMLKSM